MTDSQAFGSRVPVIYSFRLRNVDFLTRSTLFCVVLKRKDEDKVSTLSGGMSEQTVFPRHAGSEEDTGNVACACGAHHSLALVVASMVLAFRSRRRCPAGHALVAVRKATVKYIPAAQDRPRGLLGALPDGQLNMSVNMFMRRRER